METQRGRIGLVQEHNMDLRIGALSSNPHAHQPSAGGRTSHLRDCGPYVDDDK